MIDVPDETAATLADLPPEAIPRHVAVIMDGNGRWARQRDEARLAGHEAGARAIRPIVTECASLGVEALTLFSFSAENWKRPREEIDFLLDLCMQYLHAEYRTMVDHNVRFLHVGTREGLPPKLLERLDEVTGATANHTGLNLALALNYGARGELTEAVRSLARRARDGELAPEEIGEETLADHLYTRGLPDPDLLIRTAGEMRLSNFLLWQASYTEMWVTSTLWPDFTVGHLYDAIREYARRRRRFGAVEPA